MINERTKYAILSFIMSIVFLVIAIVLSKRDYTDAGKDKCEAIPPPMSGIVLADGDSCGVWDVKSGKCRKGKYDKKSGKCVSKGDPIPFIFLLLAVFCLVAGFIL